MFFDNISKINNALKIKLLNLLTRGHKPAPFFLISDHVG